MAAQFTRPLYFKAIYNKGIGHFGHFYPQYLTQMTIKFQYLFQETCFEIF